MESIIWPLLETNTYLITVGHVGLLLLHQLFQIELKFAEMPLGLILIYHLKY